jgi:CheY-like chemotaxis protein
MTRLASKQGHHPYRRGERRRKPFETGPTVPPLPGRALLPQTPPDTPVRGVVLVIEPEGPLRWSLGNALRHHGYSVVEAATFAQASVQLEQMPFDLLLLDLSLPDEGSRLLLQKLAESSELAPPILLLPRRSAGTGQEDTVQFGTILPQPAWVEDLMGLVERIRSSPGPPEGLAEEKGSARFG